MIYLILYFSFIFFSLLHDLNFLPQNFNAIYFFFRLDPFFIFLPSLFFFTSLYPLYLFIYEPLSLFLFSLYLKFTFLSVLVLRYVWTLVVVTSNTSNTRPLQYGAPAFHLPAKGQYFYDHRQQAQFLYDPKRFQWSTYCGRANDLISNAPLLKWAHHTLFVSRIHLINSVIYSGHALVWRPFVNVEEVWKKITLMIDTVWSIDFYFSAVICISVSLNKMLPKRGFGESCDVIQ
jgi:hypothetical protein